MISRPLRIVMCPPEFQLLQQVMRDEPSEATYIIQRYVAAGLQARGHQLTFIALRTLEEVVCTMDPHQPAPAPRSWSDSRWFEMVSSGSWHIQQLVGVPYLNVFSNYRLYDACLHCLPGHDLVYERNGLYRSGVAMACRRLRLPYVLYVEADDILEHDIMGKPITGLLRRRARQTASYNMQAADCIICVSQPGKEHLVRTWNVPPGKIVVFPNAVDVHQFRPRPETRTEVRAALGIRDEPLVMFVGNFYEWHDVTTLLRAFSQVLKTYPEARLVLVGDGEKRTAMAQRVADLDIGHAVHFTGLVAHGRVPRLVAAADIAVVPYPVMPQDLWLSPLKLFEYMASGTSIVASAVGQLTDVITDGTNGLLVAPEDVTAMADALLRLIGDDTLRLRLGRQAREDAERDHSWAYYLSRLERLFAAVVDGKPVDHI